MKIRSVRADGQTDWQTWRS